MQARHKAIFVLCPANHVSGGPDAFHHLVHTLNELGANAFMSYVPYGEDHAVPAPYSRIYRIPTARPLDAAENLIVIPEIMSGRTREFRHAKTAIWWQSVDFFLGYAGQGDNIRRRRVFLHDLKSLLRVPTSRMTWPEARHIEQYAPTAYAAEFLSRRGIPSRPLRDPVNEIFLSVEPEPHKQNVVAYSPAKGMQYNQQVLDALSDVPAIELRGMTHEQLIGVLRTVKIYIDFGYFPGRERMPREALLCGACIVIGRRGAAANAVDYPIPPAYKIDHAAAGFAARTRAAVLDIFDNFEHCSREFDPFRAYLKEGPKIFADDVRSIFFIE